MTPNGPRRAGRPEGQTNLASRILDVAEILFAEQGFAGTTLRQVAERLGVNAAMTAYYFKNKENLFREVFLRRGHEISRERMDCLRELEARPDHTVEDLVRAFLAPSAALRRDVQGRAFLRLQARLHMEPESLSFELRSEVYNVSTRAYADAFARLLPEIPKTIIFQKVLLLVGAYLYAFSDTNRLGQLQGEEVACLSDELLEIAIGFGTAGMSSALPPSLAGAGARR